MRLFRFFNKDTLSKSQNSFYAVAIMLFLWAIFDGIMSYLAPLVITQGGMSKTVMGVIVGSSSIFGAIFDFLMCKIFKDTNYRRVFLLMFLFSLTFPLFLSQAKTPFIFLIAMATWGIYYDLKNIGQFDFVARTSKEEDHSSRFGITQVFQSLGYFVAPLIAGLLIIDTLTFQPFAFALIFLGLSFIVFLIINIFKIEEGKQFVEASHKIRRFNFLSEFSLWGKIGNFIFPVLILTMFLNIIDAFFWTIGPLFSETVESEKFGGFFISAYVLPALLAGWFVGSITKRFGKKRTSFLALILGSLLFGSISFLPSQLLIIPVIFLGSCFIAIAWPSISGAYADYIGESPIYEKEISGLEDFFANVGFIIDPVLAGLLADKLGNLSSFSVLGVLGIILGFVLLKMTPKKINIRV